MPAKVSVVRATPDHSPFLARAILAASRSHLEFGPFDVALGLDDAEILDILEWMTLSDLVCNCHFTKFLVAEVDGTPAGALAGFDPAEPDLFPLGAALSDAHSGLGHDEDELVNVMSRIEALHRCFPETRPGVWVIEWVAVDGAYRRRGIGGHLMQAILAAGARRTLEKAQISTYIGNCAAVATYERAGFRIERERRDPAFAAILQAPGMITMTRGLP